MPLSLGQTFYVATNGNDSSPGTIDQPWRTVQKALNVLLPGQRALVRAGTYAQNHRWDRHGTAAEPVTLAAYPGERPVLRPGGGFPIEISGSYFRLQGFVIENALGTSGANVYPTGPAHHIEISNNEIRFSQDQGIYSDSSTHHLHILDNLVHDNGLGHVPGQHQSHGLYIEGDNDLIANNVVYDHPFGFGMQIYPSNQDSIVVSNTVVASGYSGIVLGGGSVTRITVRNNVFAFNDQWGIGRDASCPTATVADTNVLFGNGFGDVQGGCGGLDTSRGNRTTNPMFVNLAQRNLHLGAGSSAFDYAWASWSPWWDFDGEGRPQGAAADVGAYEDG